MQNVQQYRIEIVEQYSSQSGALAYLIPVTFAIDGAGHARMFRLSYEAILCQSWPDKVVRQ